MSCEEASAAIERAWAQSVVGTKNNRSPGDASAEFLAVTPEEAPGGQPPKASPAPLCGLGVRPERRLHPLGSAGRSSGRHPKKGFSTLNAKTLGLGNRAYFGGSLNFTKNADASNEERLVVIKNENVVATHERWFYDLLERAEAVTAYDFAFVAAEEVR